MIYLIVCVMLGSWCEFFIWNDEPTNEFLVIVLNAFQKRGSAIDTNFIEE